MINCKMRKTFSLPEEYYEDRFLVLHIFQLSPEREYLLLLDPFPIDHISP